MMTKTTVQEETETTRERRVQVNRQREEIKVTSSLGQEKVQNQVETDIKMEEQITTITKEKRSWLLARARRSRTPTPQRRSNGGRRRWRQSLARRVTGSRSMARRRSRVACRRRSRSRSSSNRGFSKKVKDLQLMVKCMERKQDRDYEFTNKGIAKQA